MKAIAESDHDYLFELGRLSEKDTYRAGVKAANEAELLQAGFLIPAGYVLSVEAFEQFMAANNIAPNSPHETVMAATIPSTTIDALKSVAASLDDAPLAVRSSAIAEDLPHASFAGQYETVLDVYGLEELEAAVRRCWASVFTDHVAAYRQEHKQDEIGIAVLVQKMVRASAAGVAFSVNPVTRNREEVVINAVRGLGDRLVSGAASPDEWTVEGENAVCHQASEEAISVKQARDIARLTRQVAVHFGKPQDIEWALAGDQLYILQARPITMLPEKALKTASPEVTIPLPIEVPSGYWQRDASHAPDPVYPMFRLLYRPIEVAVKRWFDEFGYLINGLEFREIGGWVYLHMIPPGGKEAPSLPTWLVKPIMWLLVRTMPMMRARINQAEKAVRSDKPGRFVQRWYEVWQPELADRIATLRDIELALLTNDELDCHIEDVVGLVYRGIEVHTLATGALAPILYELVSTCQDLLGWDESRILDLVNGTSFKSTEPARRLHELAAMVQENPLLSRALKDVDEGTVGRLAELDIAFAEAFAGYQKVYGCRVIGGYGLANPTLAETPSLLLKMTHTQIVNGYDPVAVQAKLAQLRARTASEAQSLLADRPSDLARFQRVLDRAEQAYPIREDNEFYTLSVPLALIRYALLELSDRLMAEGILDQTDDVFFLELEEARVALRAGDNYRKKIRRRRAQRAWAEANPGPPSYGQEPEPPTLDFLPGEARLLTASLLWYLDLQMNLEQSQKVQPTGTMLAGVAASAGQYTGPVRVIMHEDEFHKLQPGDVLVCPATSPVWSVLFPSIGALLTDTGGMLSHPAIIAREYCIPAVVALGNATELLKDGQIVAVDGTAGTVAAL